VVGQFEAKFQVERLRFAPLRHYLTYSLFISPTEHFQQFFTPTQSDMLIMMKRSKLK